MGSKLRTKLQQMSYLWQNGGKYDSKDEHFRVLYKLIIILGTPLKSDMWDVHS